MTLKKHIETVHNNGRDQCDQCYNVCKTSMTIQKHIMKLHSKNVNQCDQCEYVPTTGSDLNNHMTCRGRSMPGEVGWKRIYCHTIRGRIGGCGKESFCPKIDKCVNSVVTSLKTTCLWKSTLKWCITMAFIHVTSVTRFEKPTWPYNNTL